MTIWYLAHIAGFTLWLGGGLAAMLVGIRGRREDRPTQAVIVRLLAAIHRVVMFPGIILAIASGGVLSPRAANNGQPSSWLILMQVAGVIAAILVLFVSMPTLSRLTRTAPTGETAPRFDSLRARLAASGAIAGTLGLIALISGVLHKY
jgi:hypothetical protein